MHEMALAISIVDLAVEQLSREGGSRVIEVDIEVGSLAGVLLESLEFCLEAASRSTPLAEADFKLTSVMALGECASCQRSFEADSFFAACPACGETCPAISGGRELKVRSLTIED